MKKRGRFFVFEGIECSGKTTQVRDISEKLRTLGHGVCMTREPGGTEIGEGIRRLLLDPKYRDLMDPITNLLLHNAARQQSVKEIIMPNLEAGNIVLSDRSFISTLAYQCFAEGVDLDFAKPVCEKVMEGCMPDKIFLLDIGLEEMKRRLDGRGNAHQDRYDSMDLAFHEKIRNGYFALCEHYPDLIEKIDAEKPKEEVTIELIYKMVSIMDGKERDNVSKKL